MEHGAVAIGEKLYVFGGTADRGYFNDLHQLNTKSLDTLTWTQI